MEIKYHFLVTWKTTKIPRKNKFHDLKIQYNINCILIDKCWLLKMKFHLNRINI